MTFSGLFCQTAVSVNKCVTVQVQLRRLPHLTVIIPHRFVFSERTTLRSLYAISRPSVVCLSVVSDVGAPYSGG